MTIKTWLEKSIEGGLKDVDGDYIDEWELEDDTFKYNIKRQAGGSTYNSISIYELFLKPEAWEAVGKVEGWDKEYSLIASQFVPNTNNEGSFLDIHKADEIIPESKYRMLRMIEALCEGSKKGKSVNESIKDYLEGL